MAVKREFGERQLSEPRGRSASRNQANSASGKPEQTENIDNLVSNFLAELTDLSSEIDHKEKTETVEGKKGSLDPESIVDPRNIDEEIERSLARLEGLKAANRSHFAESADKLSDSKSSAESNIAKTAVTGRIQSDTRENAGSRSEIFGNSISSPKHVRRPKAIWAALLVLVAAVAILYLFRTDDASKGARQNARQNAVTAPETTSAPAASPVPSASSVTNAKQSGKPAPGDAAGSEHRKSGPAPKTSARASDSRENNPRPMDKNSSSGNESEKLSAEASNAPVGRAGTNEESPRASAPAPANAVTIIEQVSQPVTPPVASSQPKQNPVTAGPPAKPVPETGTAAPAAVASRGNPVTEPRPIPSADPPVPPKARIPVQAEIVKRVSPDYPAIARSQKISGKVEVEADINEKGDVTRARAVSGPILLRNAAEQALTKWKFKPASVEGVSIPSKARITIAFNLQ